MEEKNQKTVVAFIAGLLIGGLLVWVFSAAPQDKKVTEKTYDTTTLTDETDYPIGSTAETDDTADQGNGDDSATPTDMIVPAGKGSIVAKDQKAGVVVVLSAVTMPVKNGWIVVHEVRDGGLGNILGASRYSEKDGLKPTQVELLRATTAGQTYHVVVYTENGDRVFDKQDDMPVKTADGALVEDTFVAQ